MARTRWTRPQLLRLVYALNAAAVALIAAGLVLVFIAEADEVRVVAVLVAGLGGVLGPLSMLPATFASERR